MRKFYTRVLLVIIPGIIVLCLVFLVPPSNTFKKSMLYIQLDKNNQLRYSPSPRIIFIGGSNLSFGLDSKRIRDSLNLFPINNGIHALLGLKFMLLNAENNIRENDIIVISPEYQQFYGNSLNGGLELLSLIVDVSPSSIKLLDFKQCHTLLPYIPQYLIYKLEELFKKSSVDSSIGIYDRKAFNSFGDVYIHWNLPKQNVDPFPEIQDKMNDDAFKSLDNFRTFVYKKKAKLYITFPCFQSSSFNNSINQIKEVEKKLKELKFYLLSDPKRYSFPDSLIFNTPYHLTKKGVDIRTLLLIEDLKKVI